MRWKRPLFLAGATLLPLLIGAVSPGFSSQLRTFTVSIAQPFLNLQNQLTYFVRSEVESLLAWPGLRKENEALKKEIGELSGKLKELEKNKAENERLKKLLGLKEKGYSHVKAARVIGRDPSHFAQFIVINRGSHDGVRKNAVLIHSDGLVGKVVASGPRSARAILLSDGGSRASAINERTRDVGLIEGTGSLMLKMTYLDRASDIQVGDTISSSGMGGIYPKGIPIGRVEVVGSERDKLNLYALVRPFVSFSKLEEVLCVSPQTSS